MTQAEMMTMFRDLMGERGTFTFDDDETKRYLKLAIRKITRKYPTYILQDIEAVTAKENQFDLAAIVPVILSGDEKVIDIVSCQYQQGTSGKITAVAGTGAAGTGAIFTYTGTTVSVGDIIEMVTSVYNGRFRVAPFGDDFAAVPQYNYTTGNITAVADEGAGDAAFTSAAHGRTAKDLVHLVGMGVYTDGAYEVDEVIDANTFTLMDSDGTEIVYSATDTGTWRLCEAYSATATGNWIEDSNNPRQDLIRDRWETVQNMYWNVLEPTEDRPMTGAVIVNWQVTADDVPVGDMPQTMLVEGLQDCVPIFAVRIAMGSQNDERLGFISHEYNECRQRLKEWVETNVTSQPVIIGGWKNRYGRYAFRNQAKNSLIIFPRWVW